MGCRPNVELANKGNFSLGAKSEGVSAEFRGECPRVVWGIWEIINFSRGNVRGNVIGTVRSGCPEPRVGLQISTCGGYDSDHPGRDTDNTQTIDSF